MNDRVMPQLKDNKEKVSKKKIQILRKCSLNRSWKLEANKSKFSLIISWPGVTDTLTSSIPKPAQRSWKSSQQMRPEPEVSHCRNNCSSLRVLAITSFSLSAHFQLREAFI